LVNNQIQLHRIWYINTDLVINIFENKKGKKNQKRKRPRRNMKGLQNDWYPIQSDNPNILKEAGISSVRKREQQCDARERLCDEREDSLDGKPKAKKKKINIQHNKMKESEDKKGKSEQKKINEKKRI
jgi:hypothetical protein